VSGNSNTSMVTLGFMLSYPRGQHVVIWG
jgi:hypothetical protein